MLLRDIAETIGNGLNVPLVSIPAEKAGEHFGMFFGHAATQDARFERVDAQHIGMGGYRAGADQGSGE